MSLANRKTNYNNGSQKCLILIAKSLWDHSQIIIKTEALVHIAAAHSILYGCDTKLLRMTILSCLPLKTHV